MDDVSAGLSGVFLNPALLWLSAVALLPLIIHLMNRRRRLDIEWGAMQFLRDAHATRNKRVRLEEMALLALRTLMLIALVLGVARPLIRHPGLIGGERPRQDVVLVLDASSSMALRQEGTTPFARAAATASEVLDRLERGDTVGVILAGATIRSLSPTLEPVEDTLRTSLKDRLGKASPMPGEADMVRAIDAAMAMLGSNRHGTGQVVVITDGRAAAWRPDLPGRWQFLRQEMQAGRGGIGARAIVVGTPAPRLTNLRLSKIEIAQAVVGTDRPVDIRVTVSNTGTEPVAERSVSLSLDDRPLAEQPIGSLASKASAVLRFTHTFSRCGSYLFRARLTGSDQIESDDTACGAVEVMEHLPVLLVDGMPAVNVLDSATGYLRMALAPGRAEGDPAVNDLVEARAVEWSETEQTDPMGFKVVVLANVPRLGPRFTARLSRFVREGGGLLVAPGDRCDPEWYERSLYVGGEGPLPCPLGTSQGEATSRRSGCSVVSVEGQTVFTTSADAGQSDLDRVRVYRWFRFPELSQGRQAVLLRLSSGDPFVVDRTFGRGHVLLTSTPLGIDGSNLPATKAFVVMVHEMVHWLTRPTLTVWNVEAGQPLQAFLDPSKTAVTARWTDPLGETRDITGQIEGTSRVFRDSRTEMPGVYRLATAGPAGDGVFYFTVRPGNESDREPLSDRQRRELTDQLGLRFVDGAGELEASLAAENRGRELWRVLAAIVLALLVGEAFLTRRIAADRRISVMGSDGLPVGTD